MVEQTIGLFQRARTRDGPRAPCRLLSCTHRLRLRLRRRPRSRSRSRSRPLLRLRLRLRRLSRRPRLRLLLLLLLLLRRLPERSRSRLGERLLLFLSLCFSSSLSSEAPFASPVSTSSRGAFSSSSLPASLPISSFEASRERLGQLGSDVRREAWAGQLGSDVRRAAKIPPKGGC